MTAHGLPLDKAELLSVLLEALLYGFSLLMFGGTIYALWSRWSTHRVNRRMLTVACFLLLFSTVHLVIDFIRITEGLVQFRDTYPGGPIGYFSDVSQWTFVYKNYVYTAQTLLGDGVILYRCYAVWQSKLIMILPGFLWCAVGVTGIGASYTASHATQVEIFSGSLSRWITSFYASALSTNLLTTFLLAYRIWSVDRKSARLSGYSDSQLRPILHIIIDAGVIYSVTLLAALTCFANQSNGQYVVLDTVTPIISITFYMVIIRVGLASRVNRRTTMLSTPVYAHPCQSETLNADRRSGVQVHITTLTESKADNYPVSPISATTCVNGDSIKFDGAAETV